MIDQILLEKRYLKLQSMRDEEKDDYLRTVYEIRMCEIHTIMLIYQGKDIPASCNNCKMFVPT